MARPDPADSPDCRSRLWRHDARLQRFDLFCHYEPGGDFTAAVASYGAEIRPERAERQKACDTGPEATGDAPKPRPAPAFRFISVGDLEIRDPEFLVADLIKAETLSLIFGDPGCGKSFLAVDIGLSVATGTTFHGRATKQCVVFFIAGEGHTGLARRFHAWAKDREQSLEGVRLFKSQRAAQFLDGASAKAVAGHADKQRARGALALRGTLDCEFRVEKEDREMRLISTRMKDAEPPKDMFFSFRQIDLGGAASSAVLDATDATERQHKLTPSQRLGRHTYATAAAAHGVWDGGALRGLGVDDWRDAFYSKHTGDTAASKRQAFHRVRTDLVNAGEMIATNGRLSDPRSRHADDDFDAA